VRLTKQPGISNSERHQRAPKQQLSQKASEAILEAAAAVIDHGDLKFTLRTIATRLNIAPSTIHHYFASKEALVAAVKARPNDPSNQLLCLPYEMGAVSARSNRPKKRTGGLRFVNSVRFPARTTKAIDAWAKQNGVISRSESIRLLVQIGLQSGKTPTRIRP